MNQCILLILPIGGPGSGKTTWRKQMEGGDFSRLVEWGFIEENSVNDFEYTCRDDLFYELSMVQKLSSRKVRRVLYDRFQEFCAKVGSRLGYSFGYSISISNKIVYIDSANAKKGSRQHIIDSIKPDKVLLVNFRSESPEILLERTLRRDNHPTFPSNEIEQMNIINKILGGMEFADADLNADLVRDEMVVDLLII